MRDIYVQVQLSPTSKESSKQDTDEVEESIYDSQTEEGTLAATTSSTSKESSKQDADDVEESSYKSQTEEGTLVATTSSTSKESSKKDPDDVEESIYNPQTEEGTLVAITSTTPSPMIPPFNSSNASDPMLKPTSEVSMAVIGIVTPVTGLVMFQHEPQLGEFQTISKAPPMKGNEGMSPNNGNSSARPLGPFEHVTLLRVPFSLSNVVSNVAGRGPTVGALGPGWEGVRVIPGAGADGDEKGGREDGDEMLGGREDGDETLSGLEDGDEMVDGWKDGDAGGPLEDEKTEGLGAPLDARVVKAIDMEDEGGSAELGDATDAGVVMATDMRESARAMVTK